VPNEGFTVGLINDFQVPWVEKGTNKYPLYTVTVKFASGDEAEVAEGDYGAEEEGNEEENQATEEEDKESNDDDDEEADVAKDKESAKSDSGSEKGQPTIKEKKQDKKAKSSKKPVVRSSGLSTQEKREKETHKFTSKLNQDKNYFKGFN